MIEFVINSLNEVATFLPPQSGKPQMCSITGSKLSIQLDNERVISYRAPRGFLKNLKKRRNLLVVECNILGTFRETEILLV